MKHGLTIELGQSAAVAHCTCGETSPDVTSQLQVRGWWNDVHGVAVPFGDALVALRVVGRQPNPGQEN